MEMVVKKKERPRRLEKTSGQALTEAAIMLSLLAFAWMMASYMTFMTQNGIRTASAARHAAWMLGNGLTPSSFSIEDDFYVLHLQPGHARNVSLNTSIEKAFPPGSVAPFLGGLTTGGIYEVKQAEVVYSVFSMQGSKKYPYRALNMDLPLMLEKANDPNILTTTAICQWPDMKEFFENAFEIMNYIGLLAGLP